jgi:hypothetical protein
MNMYQTIVLGLGFLLLFGGGYLIKHMDDQGVIGASIATQVEASATTTLVSLSGIYVCDNSSGCDNPRILSLSADGTVTMNASYENGAEVVNEVGTWSVGINNRPIILLTGTTAGEEYSTPRMLTVRYTSKNSLSGIAFDQKVYPDLIKPIFRREESQLE